MSSEKTPAEAIPDALILAALERAQRHRARAAAVASRRQILEHLTLSVRSAAARHVRRRLQALEADGAIARSRRHGVEVWLLTPTGRRRLRRASVRDAVPPLPESPQHRRWRETHALAAREIERSRQCLAAQAERALALVRMEPQPPSKEWFALAGQLRRSAWTLGSMTHCLREWREPDDARAERPDPTTAAMRNSSLWR